MHGAILRLAAARAIAYLAHTALFHQHPQQQMKNSHALPARTGLPNQIQPIHMSASHALLAQYALPTDKYWSCSVGLVVTVQAQAQSVNLARLVFSLLPLNQLNVYSVPLVPMLKTTGGLHQPLVFSALLIPIL